VHEQVLMRLIPLIGASNLFVTASWIVKIFFS
jgi:hypothetical protein